jgi:hypothetical protein
MKVPSLTELEQASEKLYFDAEFAEDRNPDDKEILECAQAVLPERTSVRVWQTISLHQPWASLIGRGKNFETRSWSTSYRGLLAIHAAKTTREMSLCDIEPFGSCLFTGDLALDDLPLGAIVSFCRLSACVPTEQLTALSEIERAFGDYTPGRFAWKLQDIQFLPKPIPLRGRQRMWDVELDLEAALRGEIETV